jgi:hypothetical protein
MIPNKYPGLADNHARCLHKTIGKQVFILLGCTFLLAAVLACGINPTSLIQQEERTTTDSSSSTSTTIEETIDDPHLREAKKLLDNLATGH